MRTLKISNNKKVSTLQKEFNEIFPFLKVEFFNHTHQPFKGSPKKEMLDTKLLFRQCRKKHTPGTIVIKEDMPVFELEELFQELFGLSAQVFRKSGRSWIETTVTDDWTLARQNKEGQDLSFLSH